MLTALKLVNRDKAVADEVAESIVMRLKADDLKDQAAMNLISILSKTQLFEDVISNPKVRNAVVERLLALKHLKNISLDGLFEFTLTFSKMKVDENWIFDANKLVKICDKSWFNKDCRNSIGEEERGAMLTILLAIGDDKSLQKYWCHPSMGYGRYASHYPLLLNHGKAQVAALGIDRFSRQISDNHDREDRVMLAQKGLEFAKVAVEKVKSADQRLLAECLFSSFMMTNEKGEKISQPKFAQMAHKFSSLKFVSKAIKDSSFDMLNELENDRHLSPLLKTELKDVDILTSVNDYKYEVKEDFLQYHMYLIEQGDFEAFDHLMKQFTVEMKIDSSRRFKNFMSSEVQEAFILRLEFMAEHNCAALLKHAKKFADISEQLMVFSWRYHDREILNMNSYTTLLKFLAYDQAEAGKGLNSLSSEEIYLQAYADFLGRGMRYPKPQTAKTFWKIVTPLISAWWENGTKEQRNRLTKALKTLTSSPISTELFLLEERETALKKSGITELASSIAIDVEMRKKLIHSRINQLEKLVTGKDEESLKIVRRIIKLAISLESPAIYQKYADRLIKEKDCSFSDRALAMDFYLSQKNPNKAFAIYQSGIEQESSQGNNAFRYTASRLFLKHRAFSKAHKIATEVLNEAQNDLPSKSEARKLIKEVNRAKNKKVNQ